MTHASASMRRQAPTRGSFGDPRSERPKQLIDCRMLILEQSDYANGNGVVLKLIFDTALYVADRFRCGGQSVFHREKLDRAVAEAAKYDIVVFSFCEPWVPEMIGKIREINPNAYVVVRVYEHPFIGTRSEHIPDGVADLVITAKGDRLDQHEILRSLGQMLLIPPLKGTQVPTPPL